MTKADIIREGTRLGVDYGLTHSCYAPTDVGAACGRCDSCVLRRKGFARLVWIFSVVLERTLNQRVRGSSPRRPTLLPLVGEGF